MTETVVPTPIVVAPDSPAGELLAKGAAPVYPDVQAMMDQMAAMQRQIDAMRVASGVPTDPIAAALKDLQDHVTVRATMHPDKDFKDLMKAVITAPEKATITDAEYLRVVVNEFATAHKNVEGVDYLQQLANDLYKTVYQVERGV